jgi:hypothetical protein
LLREWVAGLSRLAPSVIPCRDYRPEEWAAVLSNAWHFIELEPDGIGREGSDGATDDEDQGAAVIHADCPVGRG